MTRTALGFWEDDDRLSHIDKQMQELIRICSDMKDAMDYQQSQIDTLRSRLDRVKEADE